MNKKKLDINSKDINNDTTIINKSNNYLFNIAIIILIIVLILIVIALCLLLTDNKSETKQIIEKTKNTCENIEIDKSQNIVFLGDSIAEIYPLYEIFNDLPIVNSGRSGYTTDDVLNNIDEMLYKYNPTSVIIIVGTNDISKDISDEKQKQVVNNIMEITKKIKEHRPKAKIYVQSIYPVNRNMDREMVADRTNEVIIKINKELQDSCSKNGIVYINIHDYLVDSDGNFAREYTYDGLHPSEIGYAKISRILLPYIYGVK